MQRLAEKRWTVCHSGHLHRGIYGSAGLLLRYAPANGTALFLLAEQVRPLDAKVWGIPYGVMKKGEAPGRAARRAALEEMRPVPRYRVTDVESEDCGGGWQFHIVSADVSQMFTAHAVRARCRTEWFTLEQIRAMLLARGFCAWVDRRVTRNGL